MDKAHWEEIQKMANEAHNTNDYRQAQFLQLIDKAQQIYSSSKKKKRKNN